MRHWRKSEDAPYNGVGVLLAIVHGSHKIGASLEDVIAEAVFPDVPDVLVW